MTTDDRHLLLEMHAGVHAAAQTLWERHSPRLLVYVRSLLRGDVQAAEDVVQTVMLRVLELRRRDLQAVVDVRAWFVRLCRNQAIGSIRACRRRAARERRFAGPTSEGTNLPHELHGQVEAALNRLPWRLREPVLLRRLGGLSFEQISLATGISKSTISDRYQAGIEAVKADLARELGTRKDEGTAMTRKVHHGA